MKKKIVLTENDLKNIIKRVVSETEVEEGIIDKAKDIYTGVKGMKRGFGIDYFQNMSRLRSLISKLKKLDEPNLKVMTELDSLKNKVESSNMPQARKDVIKNLIQNSLYHFNQYNSINDRILSQISTLNLDSWS